MQSMDGLVEQIAKIDARTVILMKVWVDCLYTGRAHVSTADHHTIRAITEPPTL